MSPSASPASAGTATFLTVPGRFVGPPGMGNGGYSCGRFAERVEGPAEVTLRRPVPLDRPLQSVPGRDTMIVVGDEDGTIAEVRPVAPLDEIEPPVRPTLEQVRRYGQDSPFLTEEHPYPGCFVCGPEHPEGLHIHAGPVEGRPDVCSGILEPRESLPSTDGALDSEVVWAALDCPGLTADRLRTAGPHLLGRLTVELIAPVPNDVSSVVVGWGLGSEGRKFYSGCALLTPEGDLLARSRAVWIALAKG